jgi:hypothetical protein
MKSVKYTLDLYKDIYLEGAKAGFCK